MAKVTQVKQNTEQVQRRKSSDYLIQKKKNIRNISSSQAWPHLIDSREDFISVRGPISLSAWWVFLPPLLFQSQICSPTLDWLVCYFPNKESLITFQTDVNLGFPPFSSWTQRISLFVFSLINCWRTTDAHLLQATFSFWGLAFGGQMLVERLGSVTGGLEGDVTVEREVLGNPVLDIRDGSASHLCRSVLFHWGTVCMAISKHEDWALPWKIMTCSQVLFVMSKLHWLCLYKLFHSHSVSLSSCVGTQFSKDILMPLCSLRD